MINVNYYNYQLTFTDEQVETMVAKALTEEISNQEILEMFREDIEKDMEDALLFGDYDGDDFDEALHNQIQRDFEEIGTEITKDFRNAVAEELENRITLIQNNIKNLKENA